MLNADIFNYINVLDKAADATSLRHNAIANNLANINTPGYKRQDVAFEATMQQVMGAYRSDSLGKSINKVNQHLDRLNVRAYTDSAGFSYRLDGNNVDVDTENVELASNQIKHNGLTQSLNEEFAMLKMVMK